jgi:hypothetical protein
MSQTTEADRLLALAARVRAMAAGMKNDAAKRAMLEVAASYEALAAQGESLAAAVARLAEKSE